MQAQLGLRPSSQELGVQAWPCGPSPGLLDPRNLVWLNWSQVLSGEGKEHLCCLAVCARVRVPGEPRLPTPLAASTCSVSPGDLDLLAVQEPRLTLHTLSAEDRPRPDTGLAVLCSPLEQASPILRLPAWGLGCLCSQMGNNFKERQVKSTAGHCESQGAKEPTVLRWLLCGQSHPLSAGCRMLGTGPAVAGSAFPGA